MKANRLPLVALVILACGPNHNPQWTKPCGGHVVASLSSVTLAQDCPAAAGAPRQGDFAEGICAESSGCGSLCRQSSMQLAFVSTASAASQIKIVAVRLIDPTTGAVLETLTSRDPQAWSVDKYISWNEILAPNGDLKVTYKLSAPSYSSFSSSRSYAMVYRVEVDVSVDGDVRTLVGEASQEPEVVT